MVGRLPGVSTSGRKLEDQTLPSGGGCGPKSSLQPGQADATVGCRAWTGEGEWEEAEQGCSREVVASGEQGVRTEGNAGWRSRKEAGSSVHTSDG